MASFSLNSSGAIAFTPSAPGGATYSVVKDQTQPTGGGPSLSQLFGLGAAQRATRVNTYQVNSSIASNPSKLQTATLNLAAAVGQPVLSPGDGSGALGLAKSNALLMNFDAAGTLAASTTTIAQYGALFGGALGNQASAAAAANTNAQAVQTSANNQRQSVEGVNLDQELVNLTTYQQSYSASARLVTASQDLFTALMNMVGP